MNDKIVLVKEKVTGNKYFKIGLASVLLVSTVFIASTKVTNAIESSKYTQTSQINSTTQTLSKVAVVEEIRSIAKLNILEIYTTKDFKFLVDKWYGDKEKVATFHATCRYYLDFTNIKESNVNIVDNTITIHAKQLELNIEFLEDKTEFKKTKNTGISAGELKLTIEEVEQAKQGLKQSLYADIYKTNLNEARDKANIEINKLLQTISKNDVKIVINYID